MTGQSQSFGDLLRSYRAATGMTQEVLAERAGLSARGIADLERGVRRSPYPGTVERLADALELSVAQRASFFLAGRRSGYGMQPDAEQHVSMLPGSLTSFVGRESDVADIHRLLGARRLLTLTGAGGIGKTRLAVEVARGLTDTFGHNTPFVELAALIDGALVPRAVGAVLGVREQPKRAMTSTLIQSLRGRRVLLVLDNCEHLVSACAELAQELLRGCPELHILATSRERLGVPGELAWRVRSLSLPDSGQPAPADPAQQTEAVRLFVTRAADVVPGFDVTADNAQVIAEVCRRLEGIPLALELAAARVSTLGLEGVAARLDDELRLLSASNRTMLSRQQTLRAAIDWSYRLLTPHEQMVFERLSVFAGGWTLPAAEEVCAGDGLEAEDVPALLERLVDKSLVVAEVRRDGIRVRYRLLEPLRQYATERLLLAGGREGIHRKHATFYVTLAEQGEPAKLRSAWWAGWRDRLVPEQGNFRAALRWLITTGEAQLSHRLGAALARFWLTDNHLSEGRAWLAEVLSTHDGAEQTTRGAEAALGAGQLAAFQGDYHAARSLLDQALRLARQLGDPGVLAHALYRRAELAWMNGEYARARTLSEEGVRCSQAAANRALEALNLFIDAAAACDTSEPDVAQAQLERSLGLFRAEEHPVGTGMALTHLGWVYHQRGEYAAAGAHFEEGLAVYRQVQFHWGAAFALNGLGWVATDEGHLQRAGLLLAESMKLAQGLGARGRLLESIAGLARLAAARARPELALRLAASVEALREFPASPVLAGEV
ncbi:MAG: helix-turn-helix domain-containing protein, partial [Chloroflexota bacterium]|nr:helix-turn-helix domain-containing protein [Chloroflexota bacterium]